MTATSGYRRVARNPESGYGRPEVRFWKYVNKDGPVHPRLGTPCWLWTGALLKGTGYGQFRNGRRVLKAHRYSYELHCGAFPDGQVSRHKCDVRVCVNPDHLQPGSHADNSRDMVERGRCPRGFTHPQSTLTREVIDGVRADYVKGSKTHGSYALAKKYRISQPTVMRIVSGKCDHFVKRAVEAGDLLNDSDDWVPPGQTQP